jgi:hypothetical protein
MSSSGLLSPNPSSNPSLILLLPSSTTSAGYVQGPPSAGWNPIQVQHQLLLLLLLLLLNPGPLLNLQEKSKDYNENPERTNCVPLLLDQLQSV